MTIGIVDVARFAAAVAGMPHVTTASTRLATRSAASSGYRLLVAVREPLAT
jgi:hypothetical protein